MPNGFDSSFEEDGETSQLQKLINAVVAYREEEEKQLNTLLEELKLNPTKKLVVANFHVKTTRSDMRKLTVTCDSPEDMAIWTLCLNYAVEKLNSDQLCLQVKALSASIYLDTEEFEIFIAILNPLSQRTHFIERNWIALSNSGVQAEKVDDLIESVLEIYRNETNQLIAYGLELKTNIGIDRVATEFKVNQEEDDSETDYTAYFETAEETALWRICMNAAPFMLNISSHCYDACRDYIQVSLDNSNAETIWKFLKPLTEGIQFRKVKIYAEADIMKLNADFLECGSVEYVGVDIPSEYFESYLDFMRTVRPKTVHYYRTGEDRETEDFLLPLAEIVDCIIIVNDQEAGAIQPMSISVIKQILIGKCYCLDVKDHSTIVSLNEAEQLIKFFHHLSKKVALGIQTDVQHLSTKIGEYSLESYFDGEWHLDIEHPLGPNVPDVV